MTKFRFFRTVIMVIASITILSCDAPHNDMPEELPVNYVILLDLSDRLLNAEQATHDMVQLETLCKSFARQVQQRVYILSQDRFQVRIIPQKGSTLAADQFESLLSLDMTKVDMADKADFMEQFSKRFPQVIKDLYQSAMLGNKSIDFAGVDIWKYFKYHLQADLKVGYQNKVVILTDGYFDFEDNSHVIQDAKRFTHSGFLSHTELCKTTWQQYAETHDYGYIPVQLEGFPSIIISGIRPKNERLLEEDKLKYFWRKWIQESGGITPLFISDASPVKMTQQLEEFILSK